MIQLDCECGRSFAVADSKAGQLVACPNCKRTFTAPTFVLARPVIERSGAAQVDDIFGTVRAWFWMLGCLVKLVVLLIFLGFAIRFLIWLIW